MPKQRTSVSGIYGNLNTYNETIGKARASTGFQTYNEGFAEYASTKAGS